MRRDHAIAVFEALVARYQRSGWTVRTMDRATLRANVHRQGHDPTASAGAVRRDAAGQVAVCRKLWVDAQGDAQETNIPC